MTPLAAVLNRARLPVTEARFARLVEIALDEIGAPAADDPTSVLSDDDVAALHAVGADLSPRRLREPDPRAAGAAAYTALLVDSAPVTAIAQQLGIDTSRVRHRLARGQLLGIRGGPGWLLPAYQFGDDDQPLPGLATVARAVPPHTHPVALARFFTTANPELVIDRKKVSPRQWLAGGGSPAVVADLVRGLDLLP